MINEFCFYYETQFKLRRWLAEARPSTSQSGSPDIPLNPSTMIDFMKGGAVQTADRSTIEWTDSTWNPTTGCSRISPGCENCYAEVFARRLQRMGVPRYSNGFEPTLHDDALSLPLKWKKPRKIFVNSMSDLFHERIPSDFIDRVFDTIRAAPQHIYQILTKRPYLMKRYSERVGGFPEQVWAGVSIENSHYKFRIDHLRGVGAFVKFVSIEPLLGPIGELDLDDIDWVIVGGESGTNFRPVDPNWIREVRDQCVMKRIPFFFKQWGGITSKAGGRTLDGKQWSQLPRARNRFNGMRTVECSVIE